MKIPSTISHPPAAAVSRGFTLMETVIAIGVLAVLLTGFLAVFTPAAQGIRRSISAQEADRLATTLERELVTNRDSTQFATGFEKAFNWLEKSHSSADAVFIYQYRGNPASIRSDGTPAPMSSITGQPGVDYVVQAMARQKSDPLFIEDLIAIDGSIFYVKATQLVYNNDEMVLGDPGEIADPKSGAPASDADSYPDAVIAFSAEFFSVPSRDRTYLTGNAFDTRFANASAKPIFTRNLAVRR